MNRRHAVLVLAGSILGAVHARARAQPSRRTGPARIAILDDATESTRARFWAAMRKRLQELGYVDGTTAVFVQRFAAGDPERLPQLAAELVAWKPDVLVVVTTTSALAARKTTSTIPIVAIGPADPVRSGLVASLGRPGGNLTGVSQNQFEIAGKWLELIREIVPGAKSVLYLTDIGNPGEMLVFRELEERARALGMQAQAMDGLTKANVELAFAAIVRNRTDGLIVATTAALLTQRQQIVDSAARLRVPAVYARQEYPEAGGLVSYGTDAEVQFARAADYVDRILKGAQPADLPFEMASTFRMVVNLATSRALGLKIPQSVLARAETIE